MNTDGSRLVVVHASDNPADLDRAVGQALPGVEGRAIGL